MKAACGKGKKAESSGLHKGAAKRVKTDELPDKKQGETQGSRCYQSDPTLPG